MVVARDALHVHVLGEPVRLDVCKVEVERLDDGARGALAQAVHEGLVKVLGRTKVPQLGHIVRVARGEGDDLAVLLFEIPGQRPAVKSR